MIIPWCSDMSIYKYSFFINVSSHNCLRVAYGRLNLFCIVSGKHTLAAFN